MGNSLYGKLFSSIVYALSEVLSFFNEIWASVGLNFSVFVFVILMVTITTNLFKPLVGEAASHAGEVERHYRAKINRWANPNIHRGYGPGVHI